MFQEVYTLYDIQIGLNIFMSTNIYHSFMITTFLFEMRGTLEVRGTFLLDTPLNKMLAEGLDSPLLALPTQQSTSLHTVSSHGSILLKLR